MRWPFPFHPPFRNWKKVEVMGTQGDRGRHRSWHTGAGVSYEPLMDTEVDRGGTVRVAGRSIRGICSFIGVVHLVRFV